MWILSELNNHLPWRCAPIVAGVTNPAHRNEKIMRHDRTLERLASVSPVSPELLEARQARLIEANPLIEWVKESRYLHQARVETIDDEECISFPYIAVSCYGYNSDDAVYESNRIEFERRFGGVGCHCDDLNLTCRHDPESDGEPQCNGGPEGDGECSWVRYDCGCMWIAVEPTPCRECGERNEDDPWQCVKDAIEFIDGLESYPLACEETYSQFEAAEQNRQYDDYGRYDLRQKLCTLILLDNVEDDPRLDRIEDMADEQFDRIVWDTCHSRYKYPEGSADIRWPWFDHWDGDDLTQAILDALLETEEER